MAQNNLTQPSKINKGLQKNKISQQKLNNEKPAIDAEAEVNNELKQVATIMNNIY